MCNERILVDDVRFSMDRKTAFMCALHIVWKAIFYKTILFHISGKGITL